MLPKDVCRFLWEKGCKLGDQCIYYHPKWAEKACWFFLILNYCDRNDKRHAHYTWEQLRKLATKQEDYDLYTRKSFEHKKRRRSGEDEKEVERNYDEL